MIIWQEETNLTKMFRLIYIQETTANFAHQFLNYLSHLLKKSDRRLLYVVNKCLIAAMHPIFSG